MECQMCNDQTNVLPSSQEGFSLLRSQELVNIGVSSMTCGRYDDAISALSEALTLSKVGLLKRKRNWSTVDETHFCCGQFFCDFVNMHNSSSCKNRNCRCDQKNHVIFSRPIEIIHQLRNDCSGCYSRLLFVVIYNLALAYQSSAMETRNATERDTLLRRSLRLYELAHSIHTKENSTDALFDMIVVVNNIAEIHFEIRNEVSANRCRQQLLEAIMLLVDTGEADLVQELGEVLQNVMPIVLKECVAPAA